MERLRAVLIVKAAQVSLFCTDPMFLPGISLELVKKVAGGQHALAERLVACADYDTNKVTEDIAPFSGAILLDVLLKETEGGPEKVPAGHWELMMSLWFW
jgi:hypothetical protein